MTEAEWTTCSDTRKMMDYLNRKVIATPRKLRLLACASLRRLLTLSFMIDTIDIAERFTDGHATEDERCSAREKLQAYQAELTYFSLPVSIILNSLRVPPADLHQSYCNAHAAACWLRTNPIGGDLLRDVFPTPLIRRLPRVLPSWRVTNCLIIAEGINRDAAFDRMPILADALEEAGCTNAEILAHCRGPGPHVRGCWVLDLLLGKR